MGSFQPADSSQVRARFHSELDLLNGVLEFVNQLGGRLDGIDLPDSEDRCRTITLSVVIATRSP